MWGALLAIAVTLLGLLVGTTSGYPTPPEKAAPLYSDLTPEELKAVQHFLMNRPELRLQPNQGGTLDKNCLFLVEFLAPRKSQALNYLDAGGPLPRRRARAVVFFGAEANPNVTEYIVGPLPKPTFYRPFGSPLPYTSRPMNQLEYHLLYNRLQEVLAPLRLFLEKISGFKLEPCGDRCMTFTDVAPRGQESGERRTWIILQRALEGSYLHPVGLELLIDHRPLDPAAWQVQKLWYNGQYFDSPEELAEKYDLGQVEVVPLPEHPQHSLFSTFVPRGNFTTGPPTDTHGAKVCEPSGHQYYVRGNWLEYSGWSMTIRMRTSTGLQLFDVRFNGERMAYELGVQEAVAFYGGSSPATMQTKYIDLGYMMGGLSHELAPGIDCPEVATFLDVHHMYDSDRPVRYPRAICIFELPTGVPLRRHFDSNFHGGSNFYAGLEGHALVLRTTSTVYNYDYIWDILLFPNGVLEMKVHATGYVHASFYTPEGLQYGNRIHSHLLGNLHTHLIHYKVDLDVAGAANCFETLETAFEETAVPWQAGARMVVPRLERRRRTRERQAAFPFGEPLPRYLLVSNRRRRGPFGHPRSYRLQLTSHADRLLPRGAREERGVPPGGDPAPPAGGHQQQHVHPEQPLGAQRRLRELPPGQRETRRPGPGGLGDGGLPPHPPLRGHPQHLHARQLRGPLPAPLQLLRGGPLRGLPPHRHRPPHQGHPRPRGGHPALDTKQTRPLHLGRALQLQRHLLPRVALSQTDTPPTRTHLPASLQPLGGAGSVLGGAGIAQPQPLTTVPAHTRRSPPDHMLP